MKPGHRGRNVAVATLVALIVLVATLDSLGVLPGQGARPASSPGGTGSNDTYRVDFVERGLPNEASWNVTVAGRLAWSNSTELQLWLSNGTYRYDIHTGLGFTPNPSSGTVAVDGQGVTSEVSFSSPMTPVYSVQFNITEYWTLPVGIGWRSMAYLNFSNGDQFTTEDAIIDLALANGSYPYTFATGTSLVEPEPYAGILNVSGHHVWLNESFDRVFYNLTISELGLSGNLPEWSALESSCPDGSTLGLTCGLPTGYPVPPNLPCAGWAIDHGSPNTQSSQNGTYTFLVGPTSQCDTPEGYRAIPASGAVFIDGSSVSVMIHYVPDSTPLYTAQFVESGLPSGTPWWVVIGGIAQFSNSSTIQLNDINGTLSFSVYTVGGYVAASNAGTVTLDGTGETTLVDFRSA